MNGFQKPKRLACEMETLTDTFGYFYAQPFERGFGTTLGNALRRILLSSIEGAAITAVKIEGVLHEFTSIPGVKEDVTDIIINLKQIPLKVHVDRPKTLYLERVGMPGPVKSGDIKPDPDVEILDPNIHIATLNETARLGIEMRVKTGRGYVPADENADEDLGVGYIPVDSVHSPVKKVNFWVEAARLGRATDYDRLNLQVWTNGGVKPQEAVAKAAQILKDHLFLFINVEVKSEDKAGSGGELPASVRESLNKPIEELELSVRAYNCLKNANIQTIGELVSRTESEMLKTKNFGRKSLAEIKEILAGMGLSFGMKIDEEDHAVS
jgi:DNA-directed RNA polymerase subunit alpha